MKIPSIKKTRIIMGMPVVIQIVGIDSVHGRAETIIEQVFDYFTYIDKTFSTYKDGSEIMKISREELDVKDASVDMQTIFRLSEQTKNETGGYFDIVNREGGYDPSGIVKGWAINNAAQILIDAGFGNFYVEAGGDIQVGGLNDEGEKWAIGIKNPLNEAENIKVVRLSSEGIATSGTYTRGQHIYDPHDKRRVFDDIISLTVIGPNVYEADRFSTPAFAMGRKGIDFIESLNKPDKPRRFEGYMIDSKGIATMTNGFERFL